MFDNGSAGLRSRLRLTLVLPGIEFGSPCIHNSRLQSMNGKRKPLFIPGCRFYGALQIGSNFAPPGQPRTPLYALGWHTCLGKLTRPADFLCHVLPFVLSVCT